MIPIASQIVPYSRASKCRFTQSTPVRHMPMNGSTMFLKISLGVRRCFRRIA